MIKKVIKFLKGEWNSLMYKLMFKKEKNETIYIKTLHTVLK